MPAATRQLAVPSSCALRSHKDLADSDPQRRGASQGAPTPSALARRLTATCCRALAALALIAAAASSATDSNDLGGPPSSPPPLLSPAEAASRLGPWLTDESSRSASVQPDVLLNVDIQNYAAHGRGLGTTRPVQRGEILAWLPQELSLNIRTSSMPVALKDALEHYTHHPQGRLDVVRLAAVLIFEQSRGSASQFYVALKALPPRPPINSATWSNTQKTLFSSFVGMYGSECEVHLPGLLVALAQGFRENATDPAGGTGSEASDVQSLVEQWAVLGNAGLRQRTQWACAMAISRNFRGSFYPMMDMANHNTSASWGQDLVGFDFSPDCVPAMLECFPSTGGGARRVHGRVAAPDQCMESVRNTCHSTQHPGVFGRGYVALRDYDAGEQIFDFYGRQSNLKLLFQWGFVDDSNMIGSDVLFEWGSVKYLWEEDLHSRQWEWMTQSKSATIAACVTLFDQFSMTQKEGSRELRLNLNQTAAPSGFSTHAIDCVRLLAQNFSSEADLNHELERRNTSLQLWLTGSAVAADLLPPDKDQQMCSELDGVEGAMAGPSRTEADRRVLNIVLEKCTEIADRLKSSELIPTHDEVRKQVSEGAELPGARLEVSEQLLQWIGLEVRAASACAAEIQAKLARSRRGTTQDLRLRCVNAGHT